MTRIAVIRMLMTTHPAPDLSLAGSAEDREQGAPPHFGPIPSRAAREHGEVGS